MILLTQREGTRVSARETARVPAGMRPVLFINESSECVPEREERRWTQTDRQTEIQRERGCRRQRAGISCTGRQMAEDRSLNPFGEQVG